jgi:ubiquinone/menaquinone biosynthesis C-methylase UbiE
MSGHRHFVPALGFHALTPLYDRVVGLLLREEALKRRLVEQARIAPGQRVLDLGCGTGTLAILTKRLAPEAHVIGLDVDPEVLAIAKRKAEAAGVAIEWTLAPADRAPIAAGSLDRVLSTLVLHHLAPDEKARTLANVRRWLRPDGELHVADFGVPDGLLMRAASLVVRLADGDGRVREHLEGRLASRVREAGFAEVRETHRARTPFGTLAYLAAR